YLQKGDWDDAEAHFKNVLSHHGKYLKKNNLPDGSPIAGFTGFLYCDFLLTRAEIVLGNWDPERKYLGKKSPSEEQARSDLQLVMAETQKVGDLKDQISLYDMALNGFLAQRARAIWNVLVTGAKAPPDREVHLDVNRKFRNLEK